MAPACTAVRTSLSKRPSDQEKILVERYRQFIYPHLTKFMGWLIGSHPRVMDAMNH